jgi:V8-like Glu-specific endopeptidase
LGNTVGWFGFACLSGSSLRNLLVNNAGYAGDKPFGTLWFNAGRITRVTTRRLYYMIDTYGGHSGSPVWRSRGGRRYGVGVHNYGGCPNKATRITRPVFENMKNWKNLGS